MATSISMKKTQNECWPNLVDVLRIFGADYREQHDWYNNRPACPPLPIEEEKWTQEWQAEQDALTWHPLLWLYEQIVDLTGIDINDLKEATLMLDSGWRLSASQPKESFLPRRVFPRHVLPKIHVLDSDGSTARIVKRLVNEYPNHKAVAEVLKKYPLLNLSEPNQTTINLDEDQSQHIGMVNLVVQNQSVSKNEKKSSKCGKKHTNRKKSTRTKKTEPTERDMEIYSEWFRVRSYRKVGKTYNISATAVGKHVRFVQEYLKHKSRSVQAKKLSCDKRGQVAI